jgi:hypothetical protein
MPLPLRSMMIASSSGDHLLCFFAGDSDGWEGMLRFPPAPEGARTCGGRLDDTVVDGTEAALVICCFSVGEVGDSFESSALRSREISTLTVLSRRYRQS